MIKIEGMDGHPVNDGRLCTKGLANREYIYRQDRIRTPLKRVGKRGEGKFREISWDQAYEEIAAGLNNCKMQYGAESVAFYSGYSKWYRPTLRRLAYAFGSPNYGCESSACYTAAFMAWKLAAGDPGLPGRRVHLPGPALGTADDSASVQPLQGAVGTAAVGEEDFRLSLQGLQIGETLADGPRLVVDGDDEGNLHGRTPWRKSLRT